MKISKQEIMKRYSSTEHQKKLLVTIGGTHPPRPKPYNPYEVVWKSPGYWERVKRWRSYE